MRKKSLLIAFMGHALALTCTASLAPAALITYTSRATFNGDFPGLPLEDFEESRVAPSNFGTMPNPLDSSTNNAFFRQGRSWTVCGSPSVTRRASRITFFSQPLVSPTT